MSYKCICPICKSEDTIPIAYGYPSPEAIENSTKMDVHFGGCIIDVFNQPNRHCNDCRHDWVKE